MELGLTGKVVVITGGSEGIGKGIALRLCEEGAKVAICGRRETVLADAAEEIRTQTGGEVLAIPADVTQPETLAHFIGQTARRFGKIDILVNNAGRSAGGDFETMSDEAWYDDLDLKLMGAVRCARLVIPHMKKQWRWEDYQYHASGWQTAECRFVSDLSEPRCRHRLDEGTL